MATRPISPFAEPGRLQRRQRHFTFYGVALFILVVLAVIGVAAVVLLVLGLLNVPGVTEHFRIH